MVQPADLEHVSCICFSYTSFSSSIWQLILQAIYFAKSGRQVGAVNGSSIFFTTGGLLLSIWMSRIFIINFWFTYVRPNNDKVKEANLGDFKREMWKLACILLSGCNIFDMIASWAFFGLVLDNEDSTFPADMHASGQNFIHYRGAYIALSVIQTLALIPRVWVVYRYYNEKTPESDEAAHREVDEGLKAAEETFEGFATTEEIEKPKKSFHNITGGLTFGPIQLVTALLVDVPGLVLQAIYMKYLGSSVGSSGYNSMAAFTLFFNVANVIAALILAYNYAIIWFRPILGWAKDERNAWNLEGQYRKKGYKVLLSVQILLSLSAAALCWMFYAATKSERFVWSRRVLEDDAIAIKTYTAASFTLALGITAHAVYFSLRCMVELSKTMPPYDGTIKDKLTFLVDQDERNAWTKRKMNAEEEIKSEGYDEDRLVEPYLAAVGAIGLVPHFLMVLTIGSYHQTMTQSSQGHEVFMLDCLPVAVPYASFEECANFMMENSIGPGVLARLTAMAGENVITLPPDTAVEAALSLCVLETALSLTYLWAWIRDKLDKKSDKAAAENRLLTLFSWLPSFIAIVVQVNWAVSAMLFYVNGVKGSGVNIFQRNATAVPIHHGTYRDAMLIFTILGVVAVWAFMFYAGWMLMGSTPFNAIRESKRDVDDAEEQLEKAAEAVASARVEGTGSENDDDEEEITFGFGEDAGEGGLDLADIVTNSTTNITVLEEGRSEAKKTLRKKQKNHQKNQLMPPIIVAAFGANLAFKALPHLIMVIIFVNQTSVNGIAFYCLLSLLADVVISIRVISAWLHGKHPTLNVLAWIMVLNLVTTLFAWRLEIKPHAPSLVHRLSLATSVLYVLAIGPVLLLCHNVLQNDKNKIIKRVDLTEAGGTKFEEEEFEEIYGNVSQVQKDAYTTEVSSDALGDESDDDNIAGRDKVLKRQINAVEEDPNVIVDFGTGIEAIARSHVLVPIFFGMFLLNTVPNVSTIGVAIFQRGERRAAFVLAMMANTIAGVFTLVVICWWSRKRSRTFFFAFLVSLVNVVAFWLFFAVAVAPFLTGAIVSWSAVFGAVGTVVLHTGLLKKAWDLRRNGVKLTGGKGKPLDGMKGILVFDERWDNTLVGLFSILFAWTVAIAVFQIFVLYTSVQGVKLTVFSLCCTILTTVATAVPPLMWLHARHPLLMSITLVAVVTLTTSWWSMAILFPIATPHFKALLGQ